MARARPVKSWGQLKVGMTVAGVLLVAGVAIILAGAQRGPFLPDTTTMYVRVDDAAGLRRGSQVRIGGVVVGEVRVVDIVPRRLPEPAPGDSLAPLLEAPDLRDIRLEITIQERFARVVTPSSRAQLASIGMGGERYVSISAGDVRERPLPPGSEIETVASVDWDLVLARLSRALNETLEIVATSDQIRAKLESGGGSLPRLLALDSVLVPRVRAMTAESGRLLDLLDSGPGFLPMLRRDPALAARIDAVQADLAALETSLDSGPLSQWAEREELDASLAGLKSDVAELEGRLDGGRGTLGRFLHDEELSLQIRVLQGRVSELLAAFSEDPLGFVNIELF